MRAREYSRGRLALVFVFYLAAACGPAPSKAVSHFKTYNLINSTNTAIGDLASMNSDSSDHQIVTTRNGRILASAQVQINNATAMGIRGACSLYISDGTGPTNRLTEIGRSAIWYTTDNPAYNISVPVLGYRLKAAGTYNVVVMCMKLNAGGAVNALMSNLLVWQGRE